jgi:hypothetical protein
MTLRLPGAASRVPLVRAVAVRYLSRESRERAGALAAEGCRRTQLPASAVAA